MQELQQIITSKNLWEKFESFFGTKERFTNELNNIANLRNAIRHSREVDTITKMKGEASLLWFKQQINNEMATKNIVHLADSAKNKDESNK